MQLKDAQELAIGLMEQHKLIEKGWQFQWMNKKTVYGQASVGHKIIRLSKAFVAVNELKN